MTFMNNHRGIASKVNIEYAHIYTSQTFGEDQRQSAEIMKSRERESYTRVVLIDDYNEPNSTLDVGEFIDYLEKQKVLPDFIAMESDLVPLAPLLLEQLPIAERRALESHFQKLGRINCSFLVAVWHLARLGVLPSPPLRKTGTAEKSFIAEKTIAILPRSYERNEQRALGYIKSSSFSHCLDRIGYIFF